MPRFKLIFFLLFCPFFLNGQNLIPNSSFEDAIQLNFGLTFPKFWDTPSGFGVEHYRTSNTQLWSVPQSFMGFQNAQSDSSYIGLNIYSLNNSNTKRIRDYIQTKLNRNLKADSNYCLSLHLNLPDSIQFASRNQLGIYFSRKKIDTNTNYHLPYVPQLVVSPNNYITEKTNWIKFDFEYTAIGGEQYLIIGNFNDTAKIDTLFVGGGKDPSYYSTYYFIDNLWLSHCDSIPLDTPNGISENSLLSKLRGYPNPVTDLFVLENNSNQPLAFQLYNLMGQSVELTNGASRLRSTTYRYELSMRHLPKGIYLLNIIAEGERATMKLVKE